MATHSSVLAWRIPGTGEPGGLLSMGSHRVGHDPSDLAAAMDIRTGKLLVYLVLKNKNKNKNHCAVLFYNQLSSVSNGLHFLILL